MRRIALLGALALVVINGSEIRSQIDDWRGIEKDPRIKAAIDLRCTGEPSSLQMGCEQELQQAFESDRRTAEMIVRRHCTRFSSDWTTETEPPLPICDELYGGWIEG